MTKEFIKNRKGQKIVALVEEKENAKGLTFVVHGLSGNKEQPHVQITAEAFSELGYTVVRFDTTNTLGESDGQLEDATITNYYEDLEDVIEWAKDQKFYKEPFVLAGHSLGGICVLIYAERFPEKVKAMAPISTLVSGKLILETKVDLDKWKNEGVKVWKGSSGIIKRLKWAHIEDRLKYDVLKDIDKIKVPVLLIVGEHDTSTPVKHQKILFDKLKCKKEIHVIKGAKHVFKGDKELKELKKYFIDWIESIG